MNRPTACTYLLYVVLDQYYLYSPSRFTDENSRIHSLFVENSQAMRPGR